MKKRTTLHEREATEGGREEERQRSGRTREKRKTVIIH